MVLSTQFCSRPAGMKPGTCTSSEHTGHMDVPLCPQHPGELTRGPHLGPHTRAAGRHPRQELWSVQKTMTVNLVTGFSANVIPFY